MLIPIAITSVALVALLAQKGKAAGGKKLPAAGKPPRGEELLRLSRPWGVFSLVKTKAGFRVDVKPPKGLKPSPLMPEALMSMSFAGEQDSRAKAETLMRTYADLPGRARGDDDILVNTIAFYPAETESMTREQRQKEKAVAFAAVLQSVTDGTFYVAHNLAGSEYLWTAGPSRSQPVGYWTSNGEAWGIEEATQVAVEETERQISPNEELVFDLYPAEAMK